MNQRIIGFDLARAYALLGMFIVNFNYSFGYIFHTTEPIGRFLNLFTGNSTAIFIILAGMGVSLMARHPSTDPGAGSALRSVIFKRSWFLLVLGLLLFNWWPGDILHFYGSYMHVAAFMLFIPSRYYLFAAFVAILTYHIVLFIIPVETSWDMSTFRYMDFWTVPGFLRNTLYNGWNSVFPWIAYFMLGMWLGKQDWQSNAFKRKVLIAGFVLFTLFQGIRLWVLQYSADDFLHAYVLSEYFPPYLPFMVITAGFALMVISVCMFIGEKWPESLIIRALVKTGRMTLSHYVIHLTLGMLLMAFITGKHYTGFFEDELPTSPAFILVYASSFFVISVLFSVLWSKKFKTGPLETVMRKISG